MAKKKTKTTWRRWRGKVLQNCCQTQGRIHQAIEQGTSGHIVHVKGDVFAARPRKNVPERSKRLRPSGRAQLRNIKKAQAARRRS